MARFENTAQLMEAAIMKHTNPATQKINPTSVPEKTGLHMGVVALLRRLHAWQIVETVWMSQKIMAKEKKAAAAPPAEPAFVKAVRSCAALTLPATLGVSLHNPLQ